MATDPEPAPMSTAPTPPAPATPASPPPVVVAPAPTPAAPTEHTRAVWITFAPRWVSWVPVVALTLAAFCTLFPWVGSFPGGHPIYTQGPWRAMFGKVNRSVQLEEWMPAKGNWLDQVKSDWELMLPFLVCLLLATVIAWADRGLAALQPERLPSWLRWTGALWPYRNWVVGVLAALALVFVLSQIIGGFGLERAVDRVVTDQFAAERKEAGVSRQKQGVIDFKQEQELAKYAIEHTTWSYLGVGFLMLAVVGVAGRVWLDHRGNKPAPRLTFNW